MAVDFQVVALANNGKGEFMVSVKPKASLCDGAFHKISGEFPVMFLGRRRSRTSPSDALNFCTVIKRKNVVQLHVDTVDNYKIGPQSSAPALTKSSLYVGGVPGEENLFLREFAAVAQRSHKERNF